MAFKFGERGIGGAVAGAILLMVGISLVHPGEQQGVGQPSGSSSAPVPDRNSCASMPGGICQEATITPSAPERAVPKPLATAKPPAEVKAAPVKPTITPRPIATLRPTETPKPTRVPDMTRVPPTPGPTATPRVQSIFNYAMGEWMGSSRFFETCAKPGTVDFLEETGERVECRAGCEKQFRIIGSPPAGRDGYWVLRDNKSYCLPPSGTVGRGDNYNPNLADRGPSRRDLMSQFPGFNG